MPPKSSIINNQPSIQGLLLSRRPAFRKTGQSLIDVSPGHRPFRPGLAAWLDLLRLIQTAGFEEDGIGILLGPGEERRPAIRAELPRDLPAAVLAMVV
jgi:hypothetical protein